MSWLGIHGHDEIAQRFQKAIASGRLASTFLFVGPGGIGKRSFAVKLAQALLCETNAEAELTPCGSCPACQQVAADSHPDLELIAKPSNKSFLPIELFIGDREHRMRAGLCHDIALKPFCGGRKIAIIDDADFLNQEGANCLLKTLEEPPPNSVIILVGTSEQKQLPTIRSRCQIVRFHPLSSKVIAKLLCAEVDEIDESDQTRLSQIVQLARGSLQRAIQFADGELLDFRNEFVPRLAVLPDGSIGLASDVGAFVDAAGKDAASRRERLKVVMEIAAEFYGDVVRELSGADSCPRDALDEAVGAAVRNWTVDTEGALRCLERCLEAQLQVNANANQATLIECWIDDLTRSCLPAMP